MAPFGFEPASVRLPGQLTGGASLTHWLLDDLVVVGHLVRVDRLYERPRVLVVLPGVEGEQRALVDENWRRN